MSTALTGSAALAAFAANLQAKDIPADVLERERAIAAEKAAESGKPAEIIAKMVEGTVQKFLKEVSLFNQVRMAAAEQMQDMRNEVAELRSRVDDAEAKADRNYRNSLRVRSVLRRAPAPSGAVPLEITVGELTVSTAARSVTVGGTPVGLTNREFDLLLFFLTHTDTVFSREELLKRVWNWDFGDLSTVTVHVKRLRSKLGEHHRVQTVWGRGYLWRGDTGGERDWA